MKILVTGGSGLVGQAIQKLILSSVSLSKACEWIFLSSREFNLLNIEDIDKMFSFHNPDMVVHLAANVGGLYKNMANKVQMLEDNIIMNTQLISKAHLHGIQRLICMCSTCVFPDGIDQPIYEEDLHTGPPHTSNEGYAYAKRMLEVHCRLYNECFAREYICLIPTNIYGPFDNFNLEGGHVLPCLIHKCHLAKQNSVFFNVLGSGKPRRQFIYSPDLARIIIWCLFELKTAIFHDRPLTLICCPDVEDEISIKEVAEIIAKMYGHELVKFDTTAPDGQYSKTCSNRKLKELYPSFTFTPLDVGLKLTIDWFNAQYYDCRK